MGLVCFPEMGRVVKEPRLLSLETGVRNQTLRCSENSDLLRY